ncbi:hypothetical protein BDA96_01G009100 [Sorghum bicolor]|uniref:Uncharacterized protein n=1 Tax=Sorghum bicolor TaxID=4558 RepID=A0A921RVV2_SORBI|nr:hypothetical protein BDA96_01G009100 [Sorghum bicolor]
MRKWVVNLLSAVLIVVLLVGLGYRVALVSTIPNPVQNLIPSLGLSSLELGGGGRGAGAPAKGDGGAADPPPPAARRSGPQDGGGGRTPSAPSGSGGGARTPSAPSGSGPPRMDSAPPPPPPNTQKSLLKGGSAGTGDAAAAASPPCLPCGSFEEKVTRKVVLLLGCGISTLSFSSPVIIYWSLGSSLPETITFHSLWDLIATAANCLAWLLFGITQLHIEGNRVFGAEAVLVNLLGLIVYTLCTVIKIASDANVRSKGCIGAIVALCGPTFVVLYFTVFGPFKRESLAAIWISYGAALVQFCSLLPFRSLVLACHFATTIMRAKNTFSYIERLRFLAPRALLRKEIDCPCCISTSPTPSPQASVSTFLLCRPPADAPPQHPNTKKLVIFSRGCNLIVYVYWAMYCVFTYKHDFFEAANIVGAVLALITFAIHLIYALEPQAAGPKAAA